MPGSRIARSPGIGDDPALLQAGIPASTRMRVERQERKAAHLRKWLTKANESASVDLRGVEPLTSCLPSVISPTRLPAETRKRAGQAANPASQRADRGTDPRTFCCLLAASVERKGA